MRKIISFSLWGDSKIYNYGAVENAIIAKEIYPEWECWFYIGKGVLKNVKEYLSKMTNVKIIDKSQEENKLSNMLWRFEPGFTTDDIIISRDCDSRLNIREKLAVDEWLASDKDFHIMRDHPYGHRGRVLGGMWGSRNGILKEFNYIYETFCKNKNNKYLYDMDLFNKVIYWRLGGKIYVHATYFKYEKEAKDFPKCIYDGYVGEIIEDCSRASSIFGDNENFFKQLRCME
jgi:hypothetical protein